MGHLVCYGMGPYRLGLKLGKTQQEASKILSNYWYKFPKVKALQDRLVASAKENKYAISPFDNRREWFDNINWSIGKQKSHAENETKNLPCQGGNASITKRALVYIQRGLFEYPEWTAKLVNTIHDEILTTQFKKYENEVFEFVKTSMIKAGEYYIKSIPVVVEVQLGNHWIH